MLLLDPISVTEIIHCAPQSLSGNHPLLFFPLLHLQHPCWLHRHNLVSGPICCFCWCFHCSACVFVVSPLNLWFYGNEVDLFLPCDVHLFVCEYCYVSEWDTVKERKIMISYNVLGLGMHLSVWRVIRQNAFECSHAATDNNRLYITNLLKA